MKIRQNMMPLVKPKLKGVSIREIRKIIDSGKLTGGYQIELFENAIKDYIGSTYAVAVSSGTSALQIAMLALGLEEGDEVIIPSYTFPAAAHVAESMGLNIKLIDSRKHHFDIDCSLIEKAITDKTKLIIGIHTFGYPSSVFSDKYGVPVLEDAACSIGSKLGQTMCGNLSECSILSFHPMKLLTTGEGGMFLTNNEELYKKALTLRNHGQITRGHFLDIGLNYRMTNIQAYLGYSQMKEFDKVLSERIDRAKYYNELFVLGFNGGRGISLYVPPRNGIWNYQMYPIYVPSAFAKQLVSFLRDCNIETGFGTYTTADLPYFKYKYNTKTPNATDLCNHLITLPLFYGMTHKDVEYVVDCIEKFYRKATKYASSII